MVYLPFLQKLYGTYTYIHFFSKPNQGIRWIGEILVFFQYVFFLLDFHGTEEIVHDRKGALRLLNHMGIVIPWIFTTDREANIIYWSFLMNILIILYFFIVVFTQNRKKHIHYVTGEFIVFWQAFYLKVFAFQNYIMFSLTLGRFIDGARGKDTVLLAITIFNVLTNLVNDYITSIFINPCMFNISCYLDIYDTRTNVMVNVSRFVVVLFQVLISKYRSYIMELVAICVTLGLIIYLYFVRVVSGVHSTFFSMFLDLFPIFAFPLMLLANVHLVLPDRFRLYCLLILAAIIGGLLYWYRNTMKKYCVRIFEEFLSDGRKKSKKPLLLFYTVENVLRLAAIEIDGIQIFENLLHVKQWKKTSQLIEIVRFLGVFPSQREQLLKVLDGWETKSNYYCFQIHLFKSILTSYLSNAPKQEITEIDNIYKQFLIQSYYFWKSRANKERLNVYKYGLNTMVIYSELYPVISGTLARYPFDYKVRLLYSEIQLSMCGNAKGAMKSKKLAMLLQNSSAGFYDPLLMVMGQRYPRVTQYFEEEQIKSNKDTAISEDTPKEMSLTAMSVQKDNSASCCGFMQISIALFIFLFAFILVCFIHEVLFDRSFLAFSKDYNSLLDEMNNLTASFIMPFSFEEVSKDDLENYTEEYCTQKLDNIYGEIDSFFSSIDHITKQINTLQSMVYRYINMVSVTKKTRCDVLDMIKTHPNQYSLDASYIISNITSEYSKQINFTTDLAKERYRINLFTILFIVCGISLLIFVHLSLGIFLNVHMNNLSKKAVEFLGSERRLELLLKYKSLESWDYFSELFPLENEVIDFNEYKPPFYCGITGKNYGITKRSGLQHSPSFSCTIERKQEKKRRSSVPSAIYDTIVFSNYRVDTDFLDSCINKMEKSTNKLYFIGILLTAIPAVASIVSIFFIKVGAVQRSKKIESRVNVLNDNFTQLSNIIDIDIFLANSTEEERKKKVNWFDRKIEAIQSHDSTIRYWFNKKFNMKKQKGISVNETLNSLIHQNVDIRQWFIKYTSVLIYFVDKAFFTDFKEEINSLQLPGSTNFFSFFFDIIISYGVAYIVFKYLEEHGINGLSSLFHFPNNYMDNYYKKKDLPPEHKLPNIFIQVVSSTETGFIYSISENVQDILNKKPIEFIGRKLDDVFPIDASNSRDNEMRRFQISEKNFRVFSVSRIKSEHIVSTALYDETKSNTFVNLTKVKANLATYIPQWYAMKYYEDGCLHYNYKNSYTILVRFNINEPSPATDKVYATAHTLIQGYRAMHLLWIRSGLILFVCESSDIIVPILFLNDFIESSKVNPRTNSNILSISVAREDVNAELCYFKEPFLKVDYNNFESQLKHITKIPLRHLCIFGTLSNEVGNVFGELKEVNGKIFRLIPFDDILAALDSLY